MSPLAILCLVLLLLLFTADLIIRPFSEKVSEDWSWKNRPVLHVVLTAALVALLIIFSVFG